MPNMSPAFFGALWLLAGAAADWLGPTTPTGKKTVLLGMWNSSDCGGEPANLTLSVDLRQSVCQGWTHFVGDFPDRSTPHYNSARNVRCTADGISYTQSPATLHCNNSEHVSKNKTEHISGCHQGFPPSVYTRVVDWSGCTATFVAGT